MNEKVRSPRLASSGAIVVGAFVAGVLASSVAIQGLREPKQQAVAVPEFSAPQVLAAPATPAVIEQHTVIVQNGAARSSATTANPFQRLTAGQRPPAPAMRAVAPAMAYATHLETHSAAARPRIVSQQWLTKLRSSCAARAEAQKAACERLAEQIARILDASPGREASWERAMQQELADLFGESQRAQDFSLKEVTCNDHGCILYWHSSDYADWRGAGTALLEKLATQPWFAEFDASSLRRIGQFDPLTSTPWEIVVLERKAGSAE